jgi:hypothetical protein
MRRILTTIALLALAPACVHAQAAAKKATTDADAAHDAPAPAKRRSHNPFGEVILELTRAARAQAATTAGTDDAAGPKKDAAPARATVSPLPAAPLPSAAPVLADSNRS